MRSPLLHCVADAADARAVIVSAFRFESILLDAMGWDEMQTLKSWKFAEMDFIASLKPKPPIKELDQLISATIKCYTFTQLHTFMYLDVVRGLCKNHSNNKQTSKQANFAHADQIGS